MNKFYLYFSKFSLCDLIFSIIYLSRWLHQNSLMTELENSKDGKHLTDEFKMLEFSRVFLVDHFPKTPDTKHNSNVSFVYNSGEKRSVFVPNEFHRLNGQKIIPKSFIIYRDLAIYLERVQRIHTVVFPFDGKECACLFWKIIELIFVSSVQLYTSPLNHINKF